MKSSKTNGLGRLLSFVLIVVILLFTVGCAVGGFQFNGDDLSENGNVDDKNDNTDENKDGENKDQENDVKDEDVDNTPPIDTTPQIKYYNTITGLEVSRELSFEMPIGYVTSPKLPLYGISFADISIELPTEDGDTRLLSYLTNSSSLWKIGALAPTRAFISGLSDFFGGVIISYGNDDVIKYSAWDASKAVVDISKVSDCYFVENTLYIYSGKDMINTAIDRNTSVTKTEYKAPPFDFTTEGEEYLGTSEAKTLIIPFSQNDESEFYYSEASNSYVYFKSGNRKVDLLNGKNMTYTNLFVLFSNATTYEKAEGSELIIDTSGGGKGYYVSHGKLTEFRWLTDENGKLVFMNLSGEKLKVNRGNSYIAYYKASIASNVKYS